VLSLEHFTEWFRHLDTKKIGVKVLEELQNVVLGKNGEDQMVREITLMNSN